MSQNKFISDNPKQLEESLNELNRQMAEDETKAKAAALGLPYINLHNFPIDLSVLGMFTKEEAETAGGFPFFKEGKDMRVAAINPKNSFLLEKLKEYASEYSTALYLISESSFKQILGLYGKVLRPKETKDQTVRVGDGEKYTEILKVMSDENKQKEKNASEILAAILGGAVEYGASDIHFEPEMHFVKVRFRIDGILQDILHIGKDMQRGLATRLKIISKLKLNVENIPQDGRITFYFGQKPIDVRVSVLPSAYGEEFVMRLLGTGNMEPKMETLGFSETDLAKIQKALVKTSGVIITTGPTGSGKTTTLYAFLNELNQPGVKIITLEDPVEYKLEGIVQTPIDHNNNFDFAKGLRAILRQDPDIVMVGEIRDQETAETSVQAALTGHLVLSTLHTNDSTGAIPRLLNMGVKPFVLAPGLNLILAQRLVRRLCQKCKKPAKLNPQLMERIVSVLAELPEANKSTISDDLNKLVFWHSSGCPDCHNLGYKGRIGIYEILVVDENVQELIFKQSSTTDFKKQAIKQGMVTMLQDGLLKAHRALTDVEEVFRVAGEAL